MAVLKDPSGLINEQVSALRILKCFLLSVWFKFKFYEVGLFLFGNIIDKE